LGERIPKEQIKPLIKKIAENYHLPYFTISPTFSICPIHGYLAGEHEYCPICDQENGFDEESRDSQLKGEVKNVKNKM
jgi:ribonucleoside-triphosphate reductase